MTASTPHVISPPRRQATIGNVPAGAAGAGRRASGPTQRSSMPPVPKVILAGPGGRSPGRRATPAGRRRSPAIGRRAGQRGGLADDAGRVDDRRAAPPSGCAARRARASSQSAGVGVSSPVTRGVGAVGDVERALGQRPGDPGVDGAEAQVAGRGRGRPCRAGRRAWWPTRSAPGGCRLGRELRQSPTVRRSCQPMPGPTGSPVAAVPHDRRRPLVGDADRVDRAGRGQRRAGDVERGGGQRGGVELDEAGERGRRQQRRGSATWSTRRRRAARPRPARRWCRRRPRGCSPVPSARRAHEHGAPSQTADQCPPSSDSSRLDGDTAPADRVARRPAGSTIADGLDDDEDADGGDDAVGERARRRSWRRRGDGRRRATRPTSTTTTSTQQPVAAGRRRSRSERDRRAPAGHRDDGGHQRRLRAGARRSRGGRLTATRTAPNGLRRARACRG